MEAKIAEQVDEVVSLGQRVGEMSEAPTVLSLIHISEPTRPY